MILALPALTLILLAPPQSAASGDGGALLQSACVQCHDLKPIAAAQRKTREGWRRTVNEMIWRGAPLLPGEASIVTDYLASLGPAAPPESKPAPQPRGKR